MLKNIGLILSAITLAAGAAACDAAPTPAQEDAARSAQNTGQLIEKQPVAAGNYSPTREQINAWNRTWQSRPGKLAYTYIYINGTPVGYYVLKGPPVSYAQSATNTQGRDCWSSGCFAAPNPGQDGTWANQGTGQFQWYGMDAQTGRILEIWGTQASILLSDKPLPIPGPPLGDAK